jgi:hypothetical protein
MKFFTAINILASTLAVQSATLNVTDFGARGDAISITANTVTGSSVVTVQTSNALSGADIGKLMLLFGAGPATTPTNHQDLIASIEQVNNGTNITLSLPTGATSNDVYCTYGTQNAEAFQRCADAATGTNTIIKIPAGNYLLVPPLQVTGFEMKSGGGPVAAAVVLRKGGIRFLGEGMANTILTGCGAWKLQGKFAHRGQLFVCQGPVTNNYPLMFEDLTMDGGMLIGNTSNHGFPASVRDGSGWDETHDAVVDRGTPPLHAFKAFRNCRFVHWRGEMLKSNSSWTNGFIEVTHCVFEDGDASAFNFTFAHVISGCTFSNLDMAMEFYEGYMNGPSMFENSKVRDVRADLVIVGALTNHVTPAYSIRNNKLESKDFGILLGPARNVVISSNRFSGQGFAIGTGAGYQGKDCNGNIIIEDNLFTNVGTVFLVQANGVDRMENVVVRNNAAFKGQVFADGWGWSTNISFVDNIASGFTTGLRGMRLQGQWYLDDFSNQFPPHVISDSVGTSNTITYAFGRFQQTSTSKTNSTFWIDDSKPEKIPTSAILEITHKGKCAAPLYLSTTRFGVAPVTMSQDGCTIQCAWTNGVWSVVSSNPNR